MNLLLSLDILLNILLILQKVFIQLRLLQAVHYSQMSPAGQGSPIRRQSLPNYPPPFHNKEEKKEEKRSCEAFVELANFNENRKYYIWKQDTNKLILVQQGCVGVCVQPNRG